MMRYFTCVLLVLAAGSHCVLGQGGPSLVEVVPVIERDVASGQSFIGTITPTHRAVVGSAVDGRVVEVFVEEGDRVSEKQPLAQLLTQTISLELEAAQAELALRKQQLAELENGTRPAEIEQARARLERTKVAFDFLEKEQVRLTRLHKQNATALSLLEKAVSATLEAKESHDEAKAAYQLAVDGPRVERIDQSRAQVAMQDAVVRKLQDQIKKYTIISRYSGYVTVKHTDVGEWMTQGNPVAEVVALDEVDIVAKVVEASTPFIHKGDSVRVEVPAIPDKVFTGSVVAVVPQADVRSRTFPVKIRVTNEIDESGEPLLKAGMLARVMLATGKSTKARLVPKDALVLGGRDPLIWLVNSDSIDTGSGQTSQAKATAVPVRLGIADGRLIQVEGNVPADSLVVTRGNERIRRSPTGEPSDVVWTDRSQTGSSSQQAEADSNVVD